MSINQTEAQAMESLFQALNIAFVLENKEYIRDITYEIIELIGRLDLQVCTQFIALYQVRITSFSSRLIFRLKTSNSFDCFRHARIPLKLNKWLRRVHWTQRTHSSSAFYTRWNSSRADLSLRTYSTHPSSSRPWTPPSSNSMPLSTWIQR